jgi:hypothetical protein
MFFKLKHFTKSTCGISTFGQDEVADTINLRFLVSVSDLVLYPQGRYSMVKMSNGDRYYIKEAEYNELMDALELSNIKLS